MLDINSKFLKCKDIWWCLPQDIPGIIYEADAKNRVMLYSYHDQSLFCDGQNTDFAVFKLIMCTNLDLKHAACLHMVYILQHPTSHPTRNSTRGRMVNVPTTNLATHPVSQYCKSTKCSTWWRHQSNQRKSGLQSERFWARGALCILGSEEKLWVSHKREMHFLSNAEKDKWIEDDVERGTAVARRLVEDADTAIKQEQDDMGSLENAGLTTRKPQ